MLKPFFLVCTEIENGIYVHTYLHAYMYLQTMLSYLINKQEKYAFMCLLLIG